MPRRSIMLLASCLLAACAATPTPEQQAARYAEKKAAFMKEQKRFAAMARKDNHRIAARLRQLTVGSSVVTEVAEFVDEFARAESNMGKWFGTYINGMLQVGASGVCSINYQIGGIRARRSGPCDESGYQAYGFSQREDLFCDRTFDRKQAVEMAKASFSLPRTVSGFGELLVGSRCGSRLVARIRFRLSDNVITAIEHFDPPRSVSDGRRQ